MSASPVIRAVVVVIALATLRAPSSAAELRPKASPVGSTDGSLDPSANADTWRSHLDGYMYVSGYYDNNVFDYSANDRALFRSGTSTGDKFPIDALEDYVTTVALRGDYWSSVQRRHSWRVRLLYDGHIYTINTNKTYDRFGMALRRVSRGSYLDLQVHYTPDFYLRHLYWRPMPERPAGTRYAAARFQKVSVAAEIGRRLSHRVSGAVSVAYDRRNYDFPFDERDNDTYSLRLEANGRLRPRFRASLAAHGSLSRARGSQSADPAVADVSNNRFGLEARGRWRLRKGLSFVQSADYTRRIYTSDHTGDIAHYHRRDNDFELTSQLRLNLQRGWQPQLIFGYRSSATTAPAGATDFGEYRGVRFGLQVTYYL